MKLPLDAEAQRYAENCTRPTQFGHLLFLCALLRPRRLCVELFVVNVEFTPVLLQILARRSRSELVTTKTLLKAIAPAAIMGLSLAWGPRIGTSRPAASGIAAML